MQLDKLRRKNLVQWAMDTDLSSTKARSLEHAMHLPIGFLDKDHAADRSPEHEKMLQGIIDDLATLSHDELLAVSNYVKFLKSQRAQRFLDIMAA